MGIIACSGIAGPLYEYFSKDGVVGEIGRLLVRIFGFGSMILGVMLAVISWKIRILSVKAVRFLNSLTAISEWRWLAGVFLLALILRSAWVVYMPAVPVSDFADYDRIGRDLAGGVNILSPEFTAIRPPGYPIVLSIVYKTIGHRILAVKLLNAILGSILVIITFCLVREIASQSVARIASGIVAIYPTFIFSASLLATENLSTPLFALFLLIFIIACQKGSYVLMAVAGVIFGLSCLVRTSGAAYPALIAIWLMLHKAFPLNKRIFLTLAYCLAFAAVISPWLWRNYRVFGSWGIMGTNMGLAVIHSNHPEWRRIVSEVREHGENEYEVDRELMKRAVVYIRRHPENYIKNFLYSRLHRLFLSRPEWLAQYNLKLVRWDPGRTNAVYLFILYLSSAAYYLILIMAVAGIFFAGRSPIFNSLFLWIILFNLFSLILVMGAPRYRHYMLPIFIYFASCSLSVIPGYLKRIIQE